MTSDSSGDKLRDMSVSACVFTNLLWGTAFQFWKHYYLQIPLNYCMSRIWGYSFEIKMNRMKSRTRPCKTLALYFHQSNVRSFGIKAENVSDLLE